MLILLKNPLAFARDYTIKKHDKFPPSPSDNIFLICWKAKWRKYLFYHCTHNNGILPFLVMISLTVDITYFTNWPVWMQDYTSYGKVCIHWRTIMLMSQIYQAQAACLFWVSLIWLVAPLTLANELFRVYNFVYVSFFI